MVKMGAVWDRTAEFLTDNLHAVLPIALLAFFVPASIDGAMSNLTTNASQELALVLGVLWVAFGVLSLWGWLVITAMALDANRAAHAGAVARRKLAPALIITLALFIASMLLLAPVALSISHWFTGGSTIEISTAAALYLVAVCILLLWLGARLLLWLPALVAGESLLAAVPRSWALTRGATLAILGVMLLWFVVMVVAVLATHTVFGSVFELISGPPTSGVGLSSVLTSVMVAAVRTGFTVLAPAFAAKLYLALAARRETALAA